MAKSKSLMGQVAQSKPAEETEKPSNRCPAHGCFMAASVAVEGAPFACRYHARQPNEKWQKITETLHAQKRLLNIIASADAMMPDEFDLLRNRNAFELEELLRPAPGEPFKGWRIRVKDFVHAAIQREISKIETQDKTTLERALSDAVNAFTNGTLRKHHRAKSFKDLEDAA